MFQLHLIRHLGTQSTFKDPHMVLRHLRHSESTHALGKLDSTWALGHWEGTRRTPELLRI